MDHIADNVLRQPRIVAFISPYGVVVVVPRGAGLLGPRHGHFAVATPAHLFLAHLHGRREVAVRHQHPHSPAVSLPARSSGREGERVSPQKSKGLNLAKNDVNRKLGKKAWPGKCVGAGWGVSAAKAHTHCGSQPVTLASSDCRPRAR